MSGGRDHSSRGRRLFLATSWIPLASFLAAHAYVDRFDGWGQWAAAPILLLPVLLGAAFTLAGTVQEPVRVMGWPALPTLRVGAQGLRVLLVGRPTTRSLSYSEEA